MKIHYRPTSETPPTAEMTWTTADVVYLCWNLHLRHHYRRYSLHHDVFGELLFIYLFINFAVLRGIYKNLSKDHAPVA